MKIRFKDDEVELNSFFMDDTYNGCSEETYETCSKYIIQDLKEEVEKSLKKDSVCRLLLLPTELVERRGFQNCLKPYRFELRFERIKDSKDQQKLRIIFFDEAPADHETLIGFINQRTESLEFNKLAKTIDLDTLLDCF